MTLIALPALRSVSMCFYAPVSVEDPHLVKVPVSSEIHIMEASRRARWLAEEMGFNRIAAYHIATAASELAANLFFHGRGGTLSAFMIQDPAVGLVLLAEDQGPGIADLALALTDGYSTTGSLGCGLPGVRRLMDQFDICSELGAGCQVAAVKWLIRQ